MKIKSLLLSMAAIMIIASCKKGSTSDQSLNSWEKIKVDQSLIDPQTPKDAQPFILADGIKANGLTTNAAPAGYSLVWSDEFNATTLNSSKWNITVSATSRSPRPDKGISQWFYKADQVSLNGSRLLLNAEKINSNTMYCGSIDSKDKYMPKYGYMEVRVDNASIAKAVHTAFWLQGKNQGNIDGTGHDGCEIDVFESAFSNGAQTQSTLHWDGYGANTQSWTKHWQNWGSDIHDGFHIVGLKWTSTSLTFYYDGAQMFTYSGVGVPTVSEYLWLSVGASFGDGDFASQPIGDLAKAQFDYIRVYQ